MTMTKDFVSEQCLRDILTAASNSTSKTCNFSNLPKKILKMLAEEHTESLTLVFS